MFEFLFKYPVAIFSKGEFVLLGAWPKWILGLLVLAVTAALAWRIHSRLALSKHKLKTWQAGIIWLLESLMVALLLVLLWQPAIVIAELKPQENIIAVLLDDSRSMAISENGATREAQAVKALQDGVLAQLQQKFQVRLYRLDAHLSRAASLQEFSQAAAPATHIADGIKQLASETTELPIGAVVLLSDGSDNSGGIDREAIAALRNRHIPVHTVGYGPDVISPDVEMDDAVISPRALADARISAAVSFHQHGYAGRRSQPLRARRATKVLTSREITFADDGKIQTENLLFSAGDAGARILQFSD